MLMNLRIGSLFLDEDKISEFSLWLVKLVSFQIIKFHKELVPRVTKFELRRCNIIFLLYIFFSYNSLTCPDFPGAMRPKTEKKGKRKPANMAVVPASI